jgi:hypothetical protein
MPSNLLKDTMKERNKQVSETLDAFLVLHSPLQTHEAAN